MVVYLAIVIRRTFRSCLFDCRSIIQFDFFRSLRASDFRFILKIEVIETQLQQKAFTDSFSFFFNIDLFSLERYYFFGCFFFLQLILFSRSNFEIIFSMNLLYWHSSFGSLLKWWIFVQINPRKSSQRYCKLRLQFRRRAP